MSYNEKEIINLCLDFQREASLLDAEGQIRAAMNVLQFNEMIIRPIGLNKFEIQRQIVAHEGAPVSWWESQGVDTRFMFDDGDGGIAYVTPVMGNMSAVLVDGGFRPSPSEMVTNRKVKIGEVILPAKHLKKQGEKYIEAIEPIAPEIKWL